MYPPEVLKELIVHQAIERVNLAQALAVTQQQAAASAKQVEEANAKVEQMKTLVDNMVAATGAAPKPIEDAAPAPYSDGIPTT